MTNFYFNAEKEVDGLIDQISRGFVVQYASQVLPLINSTTDITQANLLWQKDNRIAIKNGFAKAELTDRDLYSTQSLFVTTNANLNDDYFLPEETWAARHTPTHKPTNIEHNENQIVGHITSCWAVDENKENILDDSLAVDDLPPIFHLINGAVIYKAWQNEELKDRTAKLIQEIESGEKYVSMECLFTNFAYAVERANGELEIIPRGDKTAWMTKHLRAYGGTGKYKDLTIKRVLKNITFSGKGYVDKPANPESIIFNKTKSTLNLNFSSSLDNSVYNITGENSMAETINIEELQKQLDEVKASLETAMTNKIDLEAKLAEKEQVIAQLNGSLAEANSQLDNEKTNASSLTNEKNTLETRIVALEKEIGDTKIRASRLATLVDGGVSKEIAEQKIELYFALSDDQFNAIAEDLIEVVKCKNKAQKGEMIKEEKEDMEDECKSNEKTAEAANLDDVKQDKDVDLSVASVDEPQVEDICKVLASVISKQLGINQDEK
jgi:uncharacterized coiled-coil protein SlyX